MIIRRAGGQLKVILQTDHMAQSADVGRVWGHGDLLGASRPAQAVLAARLHDESWADQDLRPNIDPACGLPFDIHIQFFRSPSIPPEGHSRFYSRGVEYAAGIDLYAALLISMHASGLYLGRYGLDGRPPVDRAALPPYGREFAAGEEARQREYRERLCTSEAEVWRDYYLLQAWDRVSLFFGLGLEADDLGLMPSASEPRGRHVALRRLDEETAAMEPFPFAGTEEYFPVKAYELPDRRYDSGEDFARELAGTPPRTVAYRVVAG